MSDTLVQKLKQRPISVNYIQLMAMAADEISQLQAEIERLMRKYNNLVIAVSDKYPNDIVDILKVADDEH